MTTASSDGLWPRRGSRWFRSLRSSAAVATGSSNGARPPWLIDDRVGRSIVSASPPASSTPERMLRCPATPNVSSGWMAASGVHALRGPHRDRDRAQTELRQRELVAQGQDAGRGLPQDRLHLPQGRRRQDDAPASWSAHMFATHRGDRVIARSTAIPTPERSATASGARRPTNLSSLLADAGRIERYADIRGFTSQASSRLDVVASDDDPRITQAIGEAEFQHAIHLLEHHYNLVCLDTGTGVLESATRGILDGRRSDRGRQQLRRASMVPAPQVLDLSTGSKRTATDGSRRGVAVAVLNAVRPDTAGSSTSAGSRSHFASRCPRLRPHPVGSTSRGRGRGNGRTTFSRRHGRRLPRTRGRDRLRLRQTRQKGGLSHDRRHLSQASSSPPPASAERPTQAACQVVRRFSRSSPESRSGLCWPLSADCSSRRPSGRCHLTPATTTKHRSVGKAR